jgi:hypothetical protein
MEAYGERSWSRPSACERRPRDGGTVLDLLYLLAIVAYFALMLWYVSGCALLGRSASAGDGEPNP